MKSFRWFLIIGAIAIIITSGMFLFTDVFVPPDEKFIRELEYYEKLRYDLKELSISDFELMDKQMFFDTLPKFEKIGVTKEELREIVSRNTTYGIDPKTYPFGSTQTILNYDQNNFIIWVEEWSLQDLEHRRIYWWSPK